MPFVLEREQLVNRPRHEVFQFFADAANLQRITPAFLNFRIITPLPIAMHQGTHIDYRIALFGLPMKWRTRIDVFEPEERFVDVQLSGPYKLWRHTHTFRSAGPEKTVVSDRVEYEIGFGPLGQIAHSLFVQRTLHRIFEYRRHEIARLFASSAA